jgi:hypothetical protein
MSVTKEHWHELCKQAAVEKDPQKLMRIYDEINSILQHAKSPGPSGAISDKAKSATAS